MERRAFLRSLVHTGASFGLLAGCGHEHGTSLRGQGSISPAHLSGLLSGRPPKGMEDCPRNWNTNAWARVCSATHSSLLRIAIVGDTHIGEADPHYGKGRYEQALREIGEVNPPDVVFHLGDHHTTGAASEIRQVLHIMANSTVPVIAVVGNHELYDSAGRRNANWAFGPEDNYFDWDACRFVLLNNAVPLRDPSKKAPYAAYSGFSEPQLNWLARVISDAKRRRMYVFLFSHVTPRCHHQNHNIGQVFDYSYSFPVLYNYDPRRFYKLVGEYDKIAVCAYGHQHLYKAETINGALHVVAGGMGKINSDAAKRDPGGAFLRAWQPHYVELLFDQGNGDYSLDLFTVGSRQPDPAFHLEGHAGA